MQKIIDRLIRQALEEDIGSGDVTTQALLDEATCVRAEIIAREEIVLCGIGIAESVFRECDPDIRFEKQKSDGEMVTDGQVLAVVSGPGRGVLAGERVALNFLGVLSGIAGLTRRYVDKIGPHKASIVDTRKTRPGWRILEKYAVRSGGGTNHRLGLYDAVLIKDTHIRAVGGVAMAVNKARDGTDLKIEVETETLRQVEEALEVKADIIMLDNMDVPTMRRAVELIGDHAQIEASGNISLDNVAEVASCGVDLISVGELTHSAPCADISLKIRDIIS